MGGPEARKGTEMLLRADHRTIKWEWLLLLTGCATSPTSRDLATGTYDYTSDEATGQIIVTQVGTAKVYTWAVDRFDPMLLTDTTTWSETDGWTLIGRVSSNRLLGIHHIRRWDGGYTCAVRWAIVNMTSGISNAHDGTCTVTYRHP